MAARIVTEASEILGIRSKVRNSRIHRSACSLHQRGQALTPMRFARSFEYEPQSLLDQVPELATPQCRLRLGPAVEIVREFDCDLHRDGALHMVVDQCAETAGAFLVSFAFFCCLRLTEADTFSTAIIINELNASELKRAANGRFICKCNWNFSSDDLGPANRSDSNL
jgi:hypothetical protein